MIKKPIRIIYKKKVMNGSLFHYMYGDCAFPHSVLAIVYISGDMDRNWQHKVN